MGIEEVLELLEIDSLDQFEHFEHLAELIECGEDISYDAFATLLQGVDTDGFSELLDKYFEEILQGIPDDAIEPFCSHDNDSPAFGRFICRFGGHGATQGFHR